jgi:hypothetical protein
MKRISQSGQMTIEMILIMITLMSLTLLLMRTAREAGWAKAWVQGPWTQVQGMIEDGVWRQAGDASKQQNPQLIKRWRAFQGEDLP